MEVVDVIIVAVVLWLLYCRVVQKGVLRRTVAARCEGGSYKVVIRRRRGSKGGTKDRHKEKERERNEITS